VKVEDNSINNFGHYRKSILKKISMLNFYIQIITGAQLQFGSKLFGNEYSVKLS